MDIYNDEVVKIFFSSAEFAVIGASKDRTKYGNKVLRCYLQHQKIVWPVHPKEQEIEGLTVIHHISDLSKHVKSISIITPPLITENVVEQAHHHGIKNIWMQPGAESSKAIQFCKDVGMNLIASGPCILVYLGFKDL
jgi:hypothetical protein